MKQPLIVLESIEIEMVSFDLNFQLSSQFEYLD